MAIRSVPQPPFSTELLADLHAENMDPELGEQLWPIVRQDAEAADYLRALDEVSARVRALGSEDLILHPMPADVAARLEHFLDDIEPDETPADDPAPLTTVNGAAPEIGSVTPYSGNGQISAPVDLLTRRGTRTRWLAAAAAILAVVAGAGIAGQVLRGDETRPTARPSTPSGPVDDDLTATAALAALGRNDVSGPLGSRSALTRCVHAAGLERPILGSTDMTYRGGNAVLILLSGPTPPKITALVVGPGCTTGDPQVKNITDIG